MMISWRDLEDYKKFNDLLEKQVNHDLANIFARVKHLPAIKVRDAFVELIPELIDKYGSASAAVAAEWFEKTTGFAAIIPDLYTPEGWQASTRWALTPLFDGSKNLRKAFVNLVAVSNRAVKNHGRFTIDYSTQQYPGVFYARVLSGFTNCSFCIVLSSRGPVYGDEEKAGSQGNEYHDNCDCVVVPMRGKWLSDETNPRGVSWQGDKIDGYDFEDIYQRDYLPFFMKNDSINEVVSKRDAAFCAWVKEEKRKTRIYDRRGGSPDQPTLQKNKWNIFRNKMDERYDNLPIEQWAEAKPIPRRFVEIPVYWDKDLPYLSTKQWNHILYGFGDGGGHLSGYGWVAGGSEFGKEMTPRDIAELLKEILGSKEGASSWIGTRDVEIKRTKYRIHCVENSGRVLVKTFFPLEK